MSRSVGPTINSESTVEKSTVETQRHMTEKNNIEYKKNNNNDGQSTVVRNGNKF